MNEKELKEKIRSGEIGGAYLFAGEEDYLKRHYMSELRRLSVTDESFALFNHLVLDGKDGNIAAVKEAALAPPMFERYKLIEWKYPPLSSMKEDELSELEEMLVFLRDYDYVVLSMIVAEGEVELGTEKKPSKFKKRFADKMNIIDFPRSTDAALLPWLKEHFDAEGIISSRTPLEALIFRAGRSMDVLANEVAKLSAYLKANGLDTLDAATVSLVASSTVECDTFALQNAVLDRNKAAAFLALEEMKSNRMEPTIILGILSRSYSELLTVTSLLSEGLSTDAIAKKTGINSYRVTLCARAARNFKPGAPLSIMRELERVDVGSKYGGVSGYTAIDLFIAKCL